MGPPSNMRSVLDRNVVMRRIPVLAPQQSSLELRPHMSRKVQISMPVTRTALAHLQTVGYTVSKSNFLPN